MSVKKKRTIGPCRGVTWLYYVVLLWSRDFFLSLYLDPRFRPLLLKFSISLGNFIYLNIYIYIYMQHYGALCACYRYLVGFFAMQPNHAKTV